MNHCLSQAPPVTSRPPRRPYRSSQEGAHRPAPRLAPRFPLSPEFTAQRPLFQPGPLPTVIAKSPTGAPTLYRRRLADLPAGIRHGDMVAVGLEGEGIWAHGIVNPRAEATVRILTRGDIIPDDAWWRQQIHRAVELRRVLGLDSTTNAYRLIHAEGDGLPGLVADRYGDLVAIEAFTLGMFQRSEAVARLLCEELGLSHWVIHPGPRTLDQEGFSAEPFAAPGVRDRVVIEENGLKFEVDLAGGHKTGFFCDQRDNRDRLVRFCEGKRVLDLCCYTGGFSISARVRGHAKEVIGVDLDEQAVEQARRNSRLNRENIRFVHADAFPWIRDAIRNGKQFDVVIADPPRFISSQDEIEEGRSRYFDLNRLAMQVVAPGGIFVTCSCSGLISPDDYGRLMIGAIPPGRSGQILYRTGAGPDHPIASNCPETEYLKALWMRLS